MLDKEHIMAYNCKDIITFAGGRKMSYDTIRMSDPELYGAMKSELERQRDHIELIASENFTSRAVMEANGKPSYQ